MKSVLEHVAIKIASILITTLTVLFIYTLFFTDQEKINSIFELLAKTYTPWHFGATIIALIFLAGIQFFISNLLIKLNKKHPLIDKLFSEINEELPNSVILFGSMITFFSMVLAVASNYEPKWYFWLTAMTSLFLTLVYGAVARYLISK